MILSYTLQDTEAYCSKAWAWRIFTYQQIKPLTDSFIKKLLPLLMISSLQVLLILVLTYLGLWISDPDFFHMSQLWRKPSTWASRKKKLGRELIFIKCSGLCVRYYTGVSSFNYLKASPNVSLPAFVLRRRCEWGSKDQGSRKWGEGLHPGLPAPTLITF